MTFEKNIINSFLIILWWIGCWGLINTLISSLKLNNKHQILIYSLIIFISLFLIYIFKLTV